MELQQMAQNAEQAEALLKLMANKNRLMILCALQKQELSVSQLNEMVPLAQSALSQHLASMRKAQIVATRREGATIYYQVKDSRVAVLLESLYQLFCASSAE
ncbi:MULTISPECIES: ArsR/SmtB family transcription factor [Pseudoalteromonas]|uniref:ArsR/SmtB family transcription factor n=1 Tax=Pseudoalteromonas TaxID=53246 RepID=UPI000FFE9ADA|nr:MULTISPECIES: metalloregulator ArsR/SmtB family transcription factor [Pseudoalteromonas]MCG9758346.1 metalloregulator ArsR/SmtB family transcription factor [Pseudoalteromonas sp. Isolate6]NKC20191.1 metalloregulator ArsR/SmtB family transcription factor [Pseudoalteromonas galatheae]RXE88398.1 transcriptional regulator [Pseudoalteromonas sp. A757]